MSSTPRNSRSSLRRPLRSSRRLKVRLVVVVVHIVDPTPFKAIIPTINILRATTKEEHTGIMEEPINNNNPNNHSLSP